MKKFYALGAQLALVTAATLVTGNAWACQEEVVEEVEETECETPVVEETEVVAPAPDVVVGGCTTGVGCIGPVVTTTTTVISGCNPVLISVWGIPRLFCAPYPATLGFGLGWPGLLF